MVAAGRGNSGGARVVAAPDFAGARAYTPASGSPVGVDESRAVEGLRVHRSKIAVTAALVLTVGVLAACGGGSSDAKAEAEEGRCHDDDHHDVPPPPVAPETGLPDPSWSEPHPTGALGQDREPRRRGCAAPGRACRAADVVYEQVTEGDITRFIALFNSTIPDVVGPIRSTRAMDADVVTPLGGIFVYSGGIPESVAKINAAPGLNPVDEDKAGDAMFRDDTKSAPHNLFGNGPKLLALGGQPVPVHPLFNYLAAPATFPGDPVLSMNVAFTAPDYSVEWDYDAASNTWKRSMNGVPFTDTSGAAGRAGQRDRAVRGLLHRRLRGCAVPDRGHRRGVGVLGRQVDQGHLDPHRQHRRSPSS